MKVDSQKSVKFGGSLAATSKDLQEKSNFICAGSVAFAVGAIAGVATFAVGACMCVPGPGWVMAAVIAAVVVAALIFAGCKCASAAATRSWLPVTTSQHSKLNGTPLLTLSSQMTCPAEGGIITAQETLWEAWGQQALTNLGHIASHPLKTIFQHRACTSKLYADSFYKVQKNSHSSFEVICRCS